MAMREMNYVESCTNLVREKEKYVPIKLFNEVLNMYEDRAQADIQDLDLDLSANNAMENELDCEIDQLRKKAEKASRELFVLEEKDEKNPLDICPYCGEKMRLYLPYENRYRSGISDDKVMFECTTCGAKSPYVPISLDMFNTETVKKHIEECVEDCIVNLRGED